MKKNKKARYSKVEAAEKINRLPVFPSKVEVTFRCIRAGFWQKFCAAYEGHGITLSKARHKTEKDNEGAVILRAYYV